MHANPVADLVVRSSAQRAFRPVPGYESYHINEAGHYFKRAESRRVGALPVLLLPEVVAGSQSYLKLSWDESVVWKPLLGVMLEVFPRIFDGPALVDTKHGPWSLRGELERSGRSSLLLNRAAGWPRQGGAEDELTPRELAYLREIAVFTRKRAGLDVMPRRLAAVYDESAVRDLEKKGLIRIVRGKDGGKRDRQSGFALTERAVELFRRLGEGRA